jgi:uncharacterized UBP type Zn finger protein
MTCSHLASSAEAAPQTIEGCQECLEIGFTGWVHLRLCLSCGHVGCCDSSPYRHATTHYSQTTHAVVRSLQPGEAWRWCYVDEIIG